MTINWTNQRIGLDEMYKDRYDKLGLGCFAGKKREFRIEGRGVYYFPSGARYEGELADGTFNGKGKQLFFYAG